VIQRQRIPFLFMAVLTLLGALWTGLVRIGWDLPGAASAPLTWHGPLMVAAFLGTVIGLERAVALGSKWAYGAPFFSGVGGLILLLNPGSTQGLISLSVAAGLFLVVMLALARRQIGTIMLIMVLGAACLLTGNLLLLAGWPAYSVVGWWAAFPVLTILAERLELSKLAKISALAYTVLYGAVALTMTGLVVGGPRPQVGGRMVAVGYLVMALWFLRYDIARRRIHQPGLPRFVAVGLLVGYVWLMVSAGTQLWVGAVTSGYAYDAMNHALFLGFVFSMIFVHAPIIFPSITGLDIPFSKLFYLHLGLLHASLALRIAGDALLWLPWRQWGALLNATAIVLFFLATATAAVVAKVRSARTARSEATDATTSSRFKRPAPNRGP
jgi:hypothetical protein